MTLMRMIREMRPREKEEREKEKGRERDGKKEVIGRKEKGLMTKIIIIIRIFQNPLKYMYHHFNNSTCFSVGLLISCRRN